MTKPTQVCPACGETATYTKWKEKGRACDHCGRISVDGKVTEWCQANDFEDMLKKQSLWERVVGDTTLPEAPDVDEAFWLDTEEEQQ